MRVWSPDLITARCNGLVWAGWVVFLIAMGPLQLGAQQTTPATAIANSTSTPQDVTERQDVDQTGSTTEKVIPDRFPPIVKSETNIGGKRRQVLLAFVRENHPELERLVRSLNEKSPDQYTNAIRAIDESVIRLTNIKDNQSAERYQRALEEWKLSSRIELLTAQLSINDTAEQRKRLRKLIIQRYDNRTNFLESERLRVEERLKQINEMTAAAKKNRDVEIQRRFDLALKTSQRINTKRDRQRVKDEATKIEATKDDEPEKIKEPK